MPEQTDMTLRQRQIAVEPSHHRLRRAAMLTLILRRFLLLCMLPSYATAPFGKREMDMPCTSKAASYFLTE